ncbi:MAG: diguanylate cyclase [Candidatus Scalindua sp.]|nr:diguanylate cyclase [Candidatus Scalindua sp.]
MYINIDLLLDAIPEIVFCTDPGRNIVRTNKVMVKKLGYSSQELTAMKIEHLVPEEDRHAVKKHYILALNGFDSNLETCFLTKTGKCIYVNLSSNNISVDQEKTTQDEERTISKSDILINVAKDVTEIREMEKREKERNRKLERWNVIDKLTGLYSQKYLEIDMENEINRSRRYGHSLSVAIIRIDKLNTFEFAYGKSECENVQKKLGTLLRETLRNNVDKAYVRNMGEIVVILPETPAEQAQIMTERLQRLFNIGFDLKKHDGNTISHCSSLSAGVASLDEEDCDLLKNAREALAVSKNFGDDNVYVH